MFNASVTLPDFQYGILSACAASRTELAAAGSFTAIKSKGVANAGVFKSVNFIARYRPIAPSQFKTLSLGCCEDFQGR